ncbi:hypothetical protein VTJ04DRAFT_8469 [Mycothermus thermophilus]|uniref:uncharacterized protein n=1 Tax=Humicola insolens TaxID=85995 RepID=UPI003743178D
MDPVTAPTVALGTGQINNRILTRLDYTLRRIFRRCLEDATSSLFLFVVLRRLQSFVVSGLRVWNSEDKARRFALPLFDDDDVRILTTTTIPTTIYEASHSSEHLIPPSPYPTQPSVT